MILAVSFISTMKVDSPPLKLSEAPTRVNILSVRGIIAAAAGTKDPIWAIKVMIAVWRKSALLPLIFGPVKIMICWSVLLRSISFDTYCSSNASLRSITGWRPSLICNSNPSWITGFLYWYCKAFSAKQIMQSNVASIFPFTWIGAI